MGGAAYGDGGVLMAGTAAVTILAAEEVNKLPAPPIVFGLIAFGILCALLAITWTFHVRR
jgi:hypothetical protein